MTTLVDSFEIPPGFVETTERDGIALDIRYASANNFTGRDIYGAFDRLWLHAIAAAKLAGACAALRQTRPDLRLLVFDGLRPNRVQRVFWEMVKGTEQQRFVGDPAVGSVHGFGLAVDLSLCDRDGVELDMGTPFDDFSPLAEPRLEQTHLAAGMLTPQQLENRLLLRRTMRNAGFIPLPIEWWHFDALPSDEVRRRFKLVE
jgi:D-alanyl-D-alanine dipeptidase